MGERKGHDELCEISTMERAQRSLSSAALMLSRISIYIHRHSQIIPLVLKERLLKHLFTMALNGYTAAKVVSVEFFCDENMSFSPPIVAFTP